MKFWNVQQPAKQLEDILVAEKHKGILMLTPVNRGSQNDKDHNYDASIELPEKAHRLCRNMGVKCLAFSTNEWNATGLNYGSSLHQYFLDCFINAIRNEFDIGLILQGSLRMDTEDMMRTYLPILDHIFGENNVYVVSPDKQMEDNLETATCEIHKQVEVRRRLITL